MPRRDSGLRIADIVAAIEKIFDYTESITFDQEINATSPPHNMIEQLLSCSWQTCFGR